MLKNITLGQYYPGNSLIHRLDPRTKIILTAFFMIAVFVSGDFISIGISTAVTAAIVIMTQIPVKFIIKGIKPIIFIIIISSFFNIFFTDGKVILAWKFLRITEEGVQNATLISLRLILLVTAASVMTLTTTPMMLTEGLEKLFKPLEKIKFPVHEIAMMITIALRFIPTLLDETDKIIKAQLSRGAEFDSGGLIKRAKGFVPVIVPLFVSAFRRADELATAMEARCYKGGIGRTKMKVLKYGRVDAAAYTAAIIYFIAVILIVILL